MPAKVSAICYVHDCTERLTQDFTIKEITAVYRLDATDATKIIYLKLKAFIPSDRNIETQVDDFERGDVVYIRGKFVACAGYYLVYV